jgi:hypothetical protein
VLMTRGWGMRWIAESLAEQAFGRRATPTDPAERGLTTITINQLLQQAILPDGTTRQPIEAETVELLAVPVDGTRKTAIEPPGSAAEAQPTGEGAFEGQKKASGGGTAAIGVDDALVGLAAGVFGNGNGNGSGSGNGKPD